MKIFRNICISAAIVFFAAAAAVVTVSSQTKEGGTKEGSITLCHATGSKTNPYETITVNDNGQAHANHPADIIPAPATGCPGPSGTPPAPVPEPITMLLFGAGVAATGYAARKLRRKKSEI